MNGVNTRQTSRRAASCAIALIAALATARAAVAQEAAGEPAAARYAVEIIVFRNLDQRGNTAETPAPRAAIPATGDAAGYPPPVNGWPALEPGTLELAGMAARLRKGGAYQLLYHGGWIQPVEAQARAAASPLPAEAVAAGLRGAITLYRERYLHALVDVALATPDGTVDELQRIRQGRRLRGQAVQYFDNPALGVILAARPLDGGGAQAPDAAPATEAAD